MPLANTRPLVVSRQLDSFRQRLQRMTALRAVLLATADASALVTAFLVAVLAPLLIGPLAGDASYGDFLANDGRIRIVQILGFAAALQVWFYNRGHYQLRLPFWVETWHVVTGCAFALLSDGFLQFALKQGFSRLWLVHTWLLAVPAILIVRGVARAALRALGVWEIPALVVGSRTRLDQAIDLVRTERALGFSVASVNTLDDFAGARASSWLEACHGCGAQMVILAADEADLLAHRSLVSRLALERIPFVCVQSLGGLPVFSVDAHHFVGQEVLLLVGQSQLLRPVGRALKAVFDYSLAGLLLLVSAPLFMLFGLLIARDGGPVFYSHHRLGRDGRMFRCLKFRTMVPDAEQTLTRMLAGDPARRREWEDNHKLQGDPRITRIGRFLRSLSLDELPQLFNVLKGDMSLVGPRPIHPDETGRFGEDIDYYLRVKPGITGLWQVSGRNDLDYPRRVALNTWYVKNWSLWLDVVILLKTIPTVLSRRGAY